MVEIKIGNEVIKNAYLSWSLAEHDAIRKGRVEGLAEGEQKNKLANARNLLAMKLGTNEQIAQAVDLPLETVENLAKQL